MGRPGLLTSPVSVPEAIVRVLISAGIDTVFGVPAGKSTRIFDALVDHRAEIRTVLVREESLAGVMAEVYGRLTGKPGVVLGQSAFIISNALLGTMEAHLSGSPMLLLGDLTDDPPYSHHGPYQVGTGEYGGFDAKQILGGITKRTFVANEPAQFIQQTQLAIKHALAGNPGPVAVLFAANALEGMVGPQTRPALYETRAYLNPPRASSPPALEPVVAALARARHPIIVAGNGVRLARAFDPLCDLAELIGAPVATTAGGKGVFDERHPLALGVLGNFGTPLANRAVAAADLVFVVGSKLGPNDTANEHPDLLDPARQVLLQIDIDPLNAGWTYPANEILIGDAGSILVALAEDLRARAADQNDGPGWLEGLRADPVPWSTVTSDGRLHPRLVIDELMTQLPSGTLVCCDAGENRIFMTHFFRSEGRGLFLQPSGTGGMGYAIPAALAGQLLDPGRKAVAVCGDGGFAMSMNGLLTAVELDIPITTVILNNSALGWVRHGQGDRPIASEFAEFDFAAMSRTIGCDGYRVNDAAELGEAFRSAFESRRPAVVDIATSLDLTFRDVTSPLALAPATE